MRSGAGGDMNVEVVTRFKQQRVRNPAHLAWVRTKRCCVSGCWREPIHAHHDRHGAGAGVKPDDFQCVPLCWYHHEQGHRIGWRTWEQLHGLDLSVIAAWLAFQSRCLGILR